MDAKVQSIISQKEKVSLVSDISQNKKLFNSGAF
jgi:hypothetical protein